MNKTNRSGEKLNMESKRMQKQRSFVLFVIISVVLTLSPLQLTAGEQEYFALGDFKLDSGGVIRDCILGYRTFGKLNEARSNAVLFPTWFGGTSADLSALIGPGKLVDSTKYFVIGVDSFGNGISSSPSNSALQAGRSFPEFTMGDMVRAQYRLITEKLCISRLHAVVGISMGGMQAFYWMAAYPDFVKKAVPVTGTPRPTSYDLLVYRTELTVLEGNRTTKGWDKEPLAIVAGLHAMSEGTPGRFVALRNPGELPSYIEKAEKDLEKSDPNDLAWQLKAIMRHDIYAVFGKPAETARKIRPEVFTVISLQDHMVNPAPARELADLMQARSLLLDSGCGHYIFQCEFARISSAVSEFLDR